MTVWEKSRQGRISSLARRTARLEQAGFTLIELMIVVSILGILAAVAIPSLVGYIYKSKTVEGVSFLSEIRGRQESYRADFDQYCDVSPTQTSWMPGAPGGSVRTWSNTSPLWPGWVQLGAVPPGQQSLMSYSVVAGGPGPSGNQAALATARGFTGNDFWFIASASADLDGDGATVIMEIYSHSKSVFTDPVGGWE